MKVSARALGLTLICLLPIFCLSSCAVLERAAIGVTEYARMQTESRDTGDFTAVAASGTGQLNIRQGERSFTVTAECETLPSINTSVTDSRLTISLNDDIDWYQASPNYEIVCPSVNAVACDRTYCNAYGLSGDSLSFDLKNNSSLLCENATYNSIAVTAADSSVTLTGVAVKNLSLRTNDGACLYGSADTAVITLAGNQGVNEIVTSDSFTAKFATVTLTGSGSVYINATDTLNVTISGSGSVHYWGNPVITQNITGTGQLIKEE